MENKLELKHLCAYLPYGLMVNCDTNTEELVGYKYEANGKHRLQVLIKTEGSKIIYWTPELEMVKPILRPLSDLTEEIEINGYGKVIPIEFFENDCDDDFFADTDFREYIDMWILTPKIEYQKIKYLPNGIVLQLFEWHFDVFGLIEKGIAIDINTLNK